MLQTHTVWRKSLRTVHTSGALFMDQQSAFKSRHFQADIIPLCVRWHLDHSRSYRELKDMMQERGLSIDHTTIYRWVQQYRPEQEKHNPSHLTATTTSWSVDDAYVKIKGVDTYLYRAVDPEGNLLHFLFRSMPDIEAAKRFFSKALNTPHTKRTKKTKAVRVITVAKIAAAVTPAGKAHIEYPPKMHEDQNHLKKALSAEEADIEYLPDVKLSQPSKPLTPSLWLAFALSGIVLLLGTVILYTLVPLRSPGSTSPVKTRTTPVPPSPSNTLSILPSPSNAQPSPTTRPPVPTPTPTVIDKPISYEAEASDNTLTGSALVITCSPCSGGERVGSLGVQPSKNVDGSLQFNHVNKNRAGTYTLTIYFTQGDPGNRTTYISVNGGSAITCQAASTGSWYTVATVSVTVSLNAGNNTIKLFNPSSNAPDIDRIVV
jgi:transposase-like protein